MKMSMMNLLESLQNLNKPFFLSSLVAIFLIFFFLYKSSWSNFSTSDSSHNSPPCAPKLPIIGNLHQLRLHPHRSLASLSQLHGPLMLLHFGTVPVLVVSSSSAAREVMKTHDLAFSDRPKSIIAEKLLYNYKDVSFAHYGEYWRQVKSICIVNLLNNKRVRSFRHVREEETASMIEKIESSSSKVVNLSAMFARLTNDVVCRVALGKKYWSCTDLMKGGRNFKEVLKDFGELLGVFSIGDFIPWLAWLDGLNGLNAKLDRVAKELDVFLDRVIQEHQDGDRESSSEIDFVDVLLEIQKENLLGFPLETISIKALILDMFAAGTDTTYSVLEWAMSELVRNPSIMRKLQNEVRGIVGNKSHVTDDDLTNMQYLKAVIKETLRLHPPIPLLVPRKSTQDVKLSNYDIKANTLVMVNAWMIGRDSKSYDNPYEFDPERFFGTNSGVDYKGNGFELIPFGAGRRICPGIQFAMAINEIALANLVYKFDWEMPGEVKLDHLDMSEASGLNIHRKVPLEVVAIPFCC